MRGRRGGREDRGNIYHSREECVFKMEEFFYTSELHREENGEDDGQSINS